MSAAEAFSAEEILALPTYNWDVAVIGDEAPAFSYTVTRESIVRYCEAVRNFNPEVAESMVRAAGFTRFRLHDFDDPSNLYYEVRP